MSFMNSESYSCNESLQNIDAQWNSILRELNIQPMGVFIFEFFKLINWTSRYNKLNDYLNSDAFFSSEISFFPSLGESVAPFGRLITETLLSRVRGLWNPARLSLIVKENRKIKKPSTGKAECLNCSIGHRIYEIHKPS